MRRLFLAATFTITAAYGSLTSDVRSAAAAGDYAGAEKLVAAHQNEYGTDSELAAAVSWIGREALRNKDYEAAERYAGRTRKLAVELLERRELDADKRLPIALGASIEVMAQVMAARGELSEAIAFLNGELERWRETSIRARIQKNIHLLSLEGKPAPPLELERHIGPRPAPLGRLKGKVLLLYFWAHWCPDCRSQAPILAQLEQRYGDQGLEIIGPTKPYGFIAGGRDATESEEIAYIEHIRSEHYGDIPGMPVPVSEENFHRYGSSTTPTLVLVDRTGIVRLYHPGKMTYEELEPLVRELL